MTDKAMAIETAIGEARYACANLAGYAESAARLARTLGADKDSLRDLGTLAEKADAVLALCAKAHDLATVI